MVTRPRTAAAIALIAAALLPAAAAAQHAKAAHQESPIYLPDAAAARLVGVAPDGPAGADVIVLTQALATKETGPKETVKRFGEVYAFAPAVFAVHRDQPTRVTFRNLQADDLHDVMLTAPDGTVVLQVPLPPLTDISYVLTFHREGVFPFYCTMHQPAMSGQVIVLPATPASDHPLP